MKYKAIIETNDYKDFKFFEDGNGKYLVGKDVGATADGSWMPLYFVECQESVLGKIRTEIERYKSTIGNAISEDELKIEGMKEAYADCLEIIDKYKSEGEE